jgi:ribosomal-protein-alanine N-acetyltransferase
MAPEAIAEIAARAYRHMTPWTADQIAATLAQPRSLLAATEQAFVLGRVSADEAEILALATDPAAQRRGAASRMLARFMTEAQARGAVCVFLEVAEDNGPAVAFYRRHGFTAAGTRHAYYRRAGGSAAAACIMRRTLP